MIFDCGSVDAMPTRTHHLMWASVFGTWHLHTDHPFSACVRACVCMCVCVCDLRRKHQSRFTHFHNCINRMHRSPQRAADSALNFVQHSGTTTTVLAAIVPCGYCASVGLSCVRHTRVRCRLLASSLVTRRVLGLVSMSCQNSASM